MQKKWHISKRSLKPLLLIRKSSLLEVAMRGVNAAISGNIYFKCRDHPREIEIKKGWNAKLF